MAAAHSLRSYNTPAHASTIYICLVRYRPDSRVYIRGRRHCLMREARDNGSIPDGNGHGNGLQTGAHIGEGDDASRQGVLYMCHRTLQEKPATRSSKARHKHTHALRPSCYGWSG
jgi:hypothetical protein